MADNEEQTLALSGGAVALLKIRAPRPGWYKGVSPADAFALIDTVNNQLSEVALPDGYNLNSHGSILSGWSKEHCSDVTFPAAALRGVKAFTKSLFQPATEGEVFFLSPGALQLAHALELYKPASPEGKRHQLKITKGGGVLLHTIAFTPHWFERVDISNVCEAANAALTAKPDDAEEDEDGEMVLEVPEKARDGMKAMIKHFLNGANLALTSHVRALAKELGVLE